MSYYQALGIKKWQLYSSFTKSYTFSQYIVPYRKRMYVWMKEWVKKLSGHKAWITFLAEKMDIVFSYILFCKFYSVAGAWHTSFLLILSLFLIFFM